jgi:hypothetical protein
MVTMPGPARAWTRSRSRRCGPGAPPQPAVRQAGSAPACNQLPPRDKEDHNRRRAVGDPGRGLDAMENDACRDRVGQRHPARVEDDRDRGARRAEVGRREWQQRGQLEGGNDRKRDGQRLRRAEGGESHGATFAAGPISPSPISPARSRRTKIAGRAKTSGNSASSTGSELARRSAASAATLTPWTSPKPAPCAAALRTAAPGARAPHEPRRRHGPERMC